MGKFYGLRLALEETQRVLERQLASVDSVKAGIRLYFSSTSLLVGLMGALQIFTTNIQPGWQAWYYGGLALVLGLYLALLGLFLVSLWPTRMFLPVQASWKELVATFHDKSEPEAVDLLLSGVLNAIDLNRPILNRLARLHQAISVLFGLEVIALVLLAFLPRV